MVVGVVAPLVVVSVSGVEVSESSQGLVVVKLSIPTHNRLILILIKKCS